MKKTLGGSSNTWYQVSSWIWRLLVPNLHILTVPHHGEQLDNG